ncbi:MAG: hypothetical protein PHP05_08030 [Sideroxydans sp.]|nr:hypothetical protein [Sideroxydans sp.]
MHRTFIRIPATFFRVTLHNTVEDMTMALVPDESNANLIAHLLTEHYGLRKDERITVTPTVIRHSDNDVTSDMVISHH